MKILVLGAGGMLGHKLYEVLGKEYDTYGTIKNDFSEYEKFGIFDKNKTFERVDAEDFATVERAIEKAAPDVVINAVGVIKQLPAAKNVVRTLSINAIFPHRLAELAARGDFRLIGISTDCVFSGRGGGYREVDAPDADDLYGKSKHLGETIGTNCLSIRTSIVGCELRTRHSLLEWFLSQRGKHVKGFRRAFFSGFPTVVLAEVIAREILPRPQLEGLYHVSSEKISKYELLQLFDREFATRIEIEADDDFAIDRSLDSTKFRNLTGYRPPSWEEMAHALAEDARRGRYGNK